MRCSIKTVLVNPFNHGSYPPLALMYLSSYLKSKAADVELIDSFVPSAVFQGLTESSPYLARLFSGIREKKPRVIGLTVYSQELTKMAIVCKAIRRIMPDVIIILGGPHPTAMPQECLAQIPECDFLVRGEGEIPLYDLITGIEKGAWDHISGISYRLSSGDIRHAPDAPVISDLDSMPFPDRVPLLRNYRTGAYNFLIMGTPADLVMTSRGCPYQCSFCFKVCAKYRSHSPDYVIRQIDWIVDNIRPRYIQIMDDSFTIDKKRCSQILDRMIEKKYPCKFKVRSRVDAVDASMLQKMKRAGVDSVVYGFESGSQKMLNTFNKKTTVAQNLNAARLTRSAGLNVFGDILLFYPGETKATIQETREFIQQAPLNAASVYVLTPLPKTKVYEQALENGSLMGEWAVGKPTPWIRLDDFPDPDIMEKIAKDVFMKGFLRLSNIIWLSWCVVRSFILSPIVTMRSIIFVLFIKKSRY
jgi:anaerobic magnesium-protoporphyrin IX monomethyl ester cyclase